MEHSPFISGTNPKTIAPIRFARCGFQTTNQQRSHSIGISGIVVRLLKKMTPVVGASLTVMSAEQLTQEIVMKSVFGLPRQIWHYQLLLACLMLIGIVCDTCKAQGHISGTEYQNEKAYLVTARAEATADVTIHESTEFFKVQIVEDGIHSSYDLPIQPVTIKVVIESAKAASLTYRVGDDANPINQDRTIVYEGCDGFDTVYINLDYDLGGDAIDVKGHFAVDLVTGDGPDHVNLEVAHFAETSSLDCKADLGDDDDYFRLYLEDGSDSLTGLKVDVDAGAGQDQLYAEYYGSCVFRNGPTEITFDGNHGHDELRWFSAGVISNPQQIEFFGGDGNDVLLGWILGPCDQSEDVKVDLNGEDKKDWLGFQLHGNPDWNGSVRIDGGSGHDFYYPIETKVNYSIILENVEEFMESILNMF